MRKKCYNYILIGLTNAGKVYPGNYIKMPSIELGDMVYE